MTKNLPFLFVISLLTCCIEIDISVPSFPDISDYFDISDGLTQMIVAFNFFGFCISSFICGPLSDAYGRRSVMVIGNGVMLIGAIACVYAPTIELLLGARFVQGLGASVSCVVVFAMIADVYPEEKAAKLIGTMNSLLSIFMTVAPLAGAFITSAIGFRGNFTVLAIVSLFSWLLLYFYLPETNKQYQEFKPQTTVKNYYKLVTDVSFNLASLSPSIMYAGYLSFITCMPFLYMETYKLSIMHYSIHQGIIIFVFSILSMNFTKITNLIGEKKCVIYGTLATAFSGVAALFIGYFTPDSPNLSTLSMVFYGAGAAISYPIIFAKSLNIFPDIRGTASSALMATRALVIGVFVALASYLYNGTMLNVAFVLLIAGLIVTLFNIWLLKLISFSTND